MLLAKTKGREQITRARPDFFLPSPLALSSLAIFVFSFWLGFLCCCNKELLKCHELSGLLIFPVLSWKTTKRKRLWRGGAVFVIGSYSTEPDVFKQVVAFLFQFHLLKKSSSSSSATSPDMCCAACSHTFWGWNMTKPDVRAASLLCVLDFLSSLSILVLLLLL